MRDAVKAFLKTYELMKTIVTCRIRSYGEKGLFEGYEKFTLAPFDEEKIENFITAWYNYRKEKGFDTEKERQERIDSLRQAALGESLRELASNPMLLTTMALIHQRETTLPDKRVLLYEQAVDILLLRWQKKRSGEKLPVSRELQAFLQDKTKLREAMECIAYEAHKGGNGREHSDITRGEATELLHGSFLNSSDIAKEFLNYVDKEAGLLLGLGGEEGKPFTYSFPHRTFQEYLAGCWIIGQRETDRLIREKSIEGDYWGVAVQLGAEELLYSRKSKNSLLDLIYALFPREEPQEEEGKRVVLWSGKMAALLEEGEIKQDRVKEGDIYLKKLKASLSSIMKKGLPSIERAEAGRALAQLGDNREEVLSLNKMKFCYVPAGPFWMGAVEGDKGADDDEKPGHLNEILTEAYWISRFPVTNGQFEEFVNDKGYAKEEFWGEAIKDNNWSGKGIKGWGDDESRLHPRPYGSPFDLSSHPVVGVTWYEAQAFTWWLTTKWRAEGILAEDKEVSLPSEPQWEKAARGG